jgi:uncharacterized protein YggE
MFFQMRHLRGLMAVGVILASAGIAAAGPGKTVRKVTVSAKAEIDVVPNEVLLTFWVDTRDKDLLKAKAQNDAITRAVLALAAKHAVPQDQFTLTSLAMGPAYEKQGADEKRVFVGYDINRSIKVAIRDFSKLEPVLADALAAGVSRVDDLLFRTRRPREAEAEVRRLAVEYAREKATQLAELNGLKLGPPIRIECDVNENEQVWGMGGMGGGMGDTSSTTPEPASARFRFVGQEPDRPGAVKTNENSDKLLAPGTITLQAVVTITFEMVEPST